ncbi:MAG: type II secretion system F family protein [Deltaproteobacteria bacterium]|nr:type II secretion system F family protein [Deltaproteobacteria bacterium]
MFLYAFRTLRHPDRPNIRKRLKTISSRAGETILTDSDIVRKTTLSGIPLLNQILRSVIGIDRLYRLAQQANTRFSVGVFILLAIVLAVAGFVGAFYWAGGVIIPAILGGICATFPFFYLYIKKQKRMAKFQAQLPEALDMIARSMRAGHAFSTGMRLAADEFADPLGPEFSYALDEVNFGVSMPDALVNLVDRVDCPDLNFFVVSVILQRETGGFVVSVILQRETGGNLAEIMEKIAHLIRERFKLLDRIQTLSAEGKLSAVILSCIPIFVAGILFFLNREYISLLWTDPLNREYISLLWTDPLGKKMVAFAVIMMVFGFYVMRRIIRIKV